MRVLVLILCLFLAACADRPTVVTVTKHEVVQVPAGLNQCPEELPRVVPKRTTYTEAEVAEVARVNRLGYVQCRSTVQAILDYLREATEAVRE